MGIKSLSKDSSHELSHNQQLAEIVFFSILFIVCVCIPVGVHVCMHAHIPQCMCGCRDTHVEVREPFMGICSLLLLQFLVVQLGLSGCVALLLTELYCQPPFSVPFFFPFLTGFRSPDWPPTHYVSKAGLELLLFLPLPRVLDLQVCAILSG